MIAPTSPMEIPLEAEYTVGRNMNKPIAKSDTGIETEPNDNNTAHDKRSPPCVTPRNPVSVTE